MKTIGFSAMAIMLVAQTPAQAQDYRYPADGGAYSGRGDGAGYDDHGYDGRRYDGRAEGDRGVAVRSARLPAYVEDDRATARVCRPRHRHAPVMAMGTAGAMTGFMMGGMMGAMTGAMAGQTLAAAAASQDGAGC